MSAFAPPAMRVHRPAGATSPPSVCTSATDSQPVSRRNFAVSLVAFAAATLHPPATPAADKPPPPARETIRRDILVFQNGVRAEVVSVGTGPLVQSNSTVTVRWVLRRSNGYFIDASYGFGRFDALTYVAGQGAVIPAFETAILGMQAGGRRRFVAPPEVGYVAGAESGKPGPIPDGWGARRSLSAHKGENLVFEVHVIKVRPPEPVS